MSLFLSCDFDLLMEDANSIQTTNTIQPLHNQRSPQAHCKQIYVLKGCSHRRSQPSERHRGRFCIKYLAAVLWASWSGMGRLRGSYGIFKVRFSFLLALELRRADVFGLC